MSIKLLLTWGSLFLMMGFANPVGAQNASATEKPNIILIIGDDISATDIGAYGNNSVHTPYIDALAAKGIRFDHMFVTSSSCSPSRSSILTSRYPHNTEAAELHTPLPAHLIYFPELLRKAGYFTALAGKWHEGPATRRAYDTMLVKRKDNGPGGERQWVPLLNKAIDQKQPFFLWLAAYDGHRPWSPNKDFKKLHDPGQLKVPDELLDDTATRQDLASFYNEISRLDGFVGRIIACLEKRQVLENTIVIFMGDNGRPFPGSKTRVNDRGLNVPFIWYAPGTLKKSGQTAALVSSIDIAPTLLDLAGVPGAASFQGASFTKLLDYPDSAFRNYVFAEHNWHNFESYERSVRTKDFLYIYNGRPQFANGGPKDVVNSASYSSLLKAYQHQDKNLTPLQQDPYIAPRPKEELYDLRLDPQQLINIQGQKNYQTQLAKLRAVLNNWQQETGDTEPDHLTPTIEDGKIIRGEMPGKSRDAGHINRKGPF